MLRRLPHRRLTAVLTTCLTAALLSACGGGTKSSTTTSTSAPPEGPRPAASRSPSTIFEDEIQIRAHPAVTLNQLKQLGVDTIRIWFDWDGIAPDHDSFTKPDFNAGDPAAYPASSWKIYDEMVQAVLARHMGILALVSGPAPQWATSPGEPAGGPPGIWKPNAADYGEFYKAVATRYSGHYTPPGASKPLPRITFWSAWNEPNHGTEIAPQTKNSSKYEVAPTVYRNLLDAGYKALQETGHGRDTLLIGDFAPTGRTIPANKFPGIFAQMVPLRFMRALYCVDAKYKPWQGTDATERGCPADAAGSRNFPKDHPALFKAAGLAVHPYSQGLPPNVPTPAEPDYGDLADMGNVEKAIDAVQRTYGFTRRLPLWDTEFGYQTTPPDREAGTTSLEDAAYYLNWAEYLHWKNPRLKSYDQYQLVDSPTGLFATGLYLATGQVKPGYFAFRMPLYLPVTKGSAGQALEVWGCVRPAPEAQLQSKQPQQVRIQFRAGNSGAWTTVQTVTVTDPHGYFDVRQSFKSSGQVRLFWTYPNGLEISSRTVNVTVG